MKEKNQAYFRANRELFLKKWAGLFVLISEQKVRGVYKEAWEGVLAAAQMGLDVDEFIVWNVN